jgi:hypothetical protein
LDEEETAELYNEASSGIDRATASFGNNVLLEWENRKAKLEHDCSIAGWCLSVQKDVFDDCSARFTGMHKDALERVVRKLHRSPCPNKHPNLTDTEDAIVEFFFAKYKTFRKKHHPFDREYKWNTKMAQSGQSWRWYEEHSLEYTVVFGFVACRVCSKTLGIGPCKRSWGGVKNIKTGKRSHLSGDSTEKRAIIYTTALMDTARLHRNAMEKADAQKYDIFGEDDMR